MSKNKYKDVDELKREQNLSEETFVEETAIDENDEVETTTKFVSSEVVEDIVNEENNMNEKINLSEEK